MNKEISYKQLIDSDSAETGYKACVYGDMTVQIKLHPSLADILQVVDEVVDGCFLDDGSYYPELVYFLELHSLIQNLTNVELPEDLSECYDFILNSGFGDWVYSKLANPSDTFIYDLDDAIHKKIDYMANSGIMVLRSKMNELFMALDNFAEQSAELFGNITVEDRDKLISAVDSIGGLDEERLVKAFVKQDKKTKAKKHMEK